MQGGKGSSSGRRDASMSGTVDLTTCVDEEAGYHDMHMQGVQQLQGIHSLYGDLFDDTNPEYLGYLSSHRTHLSDFDHAALPSPSLTYQRGRMGGEAAQQEQQHGFDMIAADGGMLHMPHLMLQQHHNHPHTQLPCPLIGGGGDGQLRSEPWSWFSFRSQIRWIREASQAPGPFRRE